MKVVIRVKDGADVEKIRGFFSMFRFPNITFCQKEAALAEETFCINVLEGDGDLRARDIENILTDDDCSVLIFNDDAKSLDEPKVIFATDHSDQAAVNLEEFKKLRPAGFAGATVIAEANTTSSELLNHEVNVRFLERTKTAAQSTQANVIIANFDLKNLGRKSAQLTNIMKMVLQNRCHVLILKSY